MLYFCVCYGTGSVKYLTLLQSCSQQNSSLGHVLRVWLDQQLRVHKWSLHPPTQGRERRKDLQLLFQAGADQLVTASQILYKRCSSSYKYVTSVWIKSEWKAKRSSQIPRNFWIFWTRASAARFSSSDSLVHSSSSSGQLSTRIKIILKGLPQCW